ncbi:MAG: hypothetical protein EHM14_11670 [Methanothrix sp.]|nr:MAG: hypothetical protein EHM14_11670 [Methanothrix sp.]
MVEGIDCFKAFVLLLLCFLILTFMCMHLTRNGQAVAEMCPVKIVKQQLMSQNYSSFEGSEAEYNRLCLILGGWIK